MRRAARHLLTLCSALSMLILLGLLVVWQMGPERPYGLMRSAVYRGDVVSHRRFERVTIESACFDEAPDDAKVRWSRVRGPARPDWQYGWPQYRSDPVFLRWSGLGVEYRGYRFGTDAHQDFAGRLIQIPCAYLVAVSMVLPITWFRSWRRRCRIAARARAGRCARCGYDLTGNVSGVCPECGTPVSALPSPDV